MQPSDVVHEIFSIFTRNGHRMYGESVTEAQHALQCATLAQKAGESNEVVAACLLHDYGHLLHDLGEDIAAKGIDARHEHIGANRLMSWFPPAVVDPIRMHADSKRYLCFRESGYLEGLSPASVRSLHLQGGPMTEAEAADFERSPAFENAVRVRRYDDLGKDPAMVTPPLEAFRSLLESLVYRS